MLDYNRRSTFADQVNAAVDLALTADQATRTPRDYLGGSRLGHACERALQFEFTTAPKDEGQDFSGQSLRIFAIGHALEDLAVAWLRGAGFDLYTRKGNRPDGGQFGFSVAGGRIRGHVDGIIAAGPVGFDLAVPALWECKTMNAKNWWACVKDGVTKSKPVYAAQIAVYQAYMEASVPGISAAPAVFTAINKDTAEMHHELVSAVTNKTLRQAYETYPRTFMLFCRQVLATDFKAMNRVQLGEAPQLLEVGESGEFKRGTLGESKESYKVKTYGRVVAITRQTLINDDLDAFTRIPAMYGNSIAQLESDVVWGIITANPAMADGNALFHTTHKNLAATGTALAVDAVGAARAAMALQTGFDKKTVLNIRPAFLIVPAALELKAEQLVAQNLVPADSTKVVPQSIRTLSPISEPRLDAASPTAWYLAANPNQIDTIEYAYLEGQQGAYVETRNGFDVDGVEIKCRLDFGAKAIDWRGLYRNPGA